MSDGAAGSQFRRATAVVLLGSVSGYGINLLLTPVISRIFAPEAFGEFSMLLAASSAFVGVSTLRLEMRAQVEESEHRAASLFGLALVSNLTASLVISLLAIAAVVLWDVPATWCLAGLLVFSGSLQLIGQAVLARSARYNLLAGTNFVQGAGTALAQVAIGTVRPTVAALISGFVLPRSVWVLVAPPLRSRVVHLRRTWSQHRRFAVLAGASACVNSVAGQSLILVVSWTSGVIAAGVVAMAVRLIIGPLSIVGQAGAAAAVGEVGRCLRENRSALPVLRRGVRDLFLLGLLPCLVVAGVAPFLAGPILGARWEPVGWAVSCLAIGGLAQFCVSPFSQTMNLAGASSQLLRWDLARLVSLVLAIAIPSGLGAPLNAALLCYSAVQIALYSLMYFMLRSILAN